MRKPSPPLNDADAFDQPDLLVFVPKGESLHETAKFLTESADENGLPQSHIRADAARGGFWVSDDLADIVYDDDEPAPEPEPEKKAPKTPAKAPAKTGSTAKKGTKNS